MTNLITDDIPQIDEKRIPTYVRREVAGTNGKTGNYGYVLIKPMDDYHDAIIRKVTPFQRKCILLYYVERHDGRSFPISKFTRPLGVNDRSIQYDLRWLERNGYLKTEKRYGSKGEQISNLYFFLKPITDGFYDRKPTIRRIYAKNNPLILRQWHWDDYKTIPGRNDEYHNAFDKYENFMELSEKKEEMKNAEWTEFVEKNMSKPMKRILKKEIRKSSGKRKNPKICQ